jgi:hypothetical protein
MLFVSSETELLGNHPEWSALPNDSFRSEVTQNWRLEKVARDLPQEVQIPSPPPSSSQAVPQFHEIIPGSTGSRLFQLLNKIKPSANARPPPQGTAAGAEASDVAKRKLKM